MQTDAVRTGKATWGNWGPHGLKYSEWLNHSNRLIPVYSFGMDLSDVAGEKSIYRDADRLRALYGFLPRARSIEAAVYFDQTNIYRLQKLAAERGKKRIILFIFDGMDWWNTYAAAIYKSGKVGYHEGRGTGLHLQDYRGTQTDYGYMVTSPHDAGAKVDINKQTITLLGPARGGYDWWLAGETPWSVAHEPLYLIAQSKRRKQASPIRRPRQLR